MGLENLKSVFTKIYGDLEPSDLTSIKSQHQRTSAMHNTDMKDAPQPELKVQNNWPDPPAGFTTYMKKWKGSELAPGGGPTYIQPSLMISEFGQIGLRRDLWPSPVFGFTHMQTPADTELGVTDVPLRGQIPSTSDYGVDQNRQSLEKIWKNGKLQIFGNGMVDLTSLSVSGAPYNDNDITTFNATNNPYSFAFSSINKPERSMRT